MSNDANMGPSIKTRPPNWDEDQGPKLRAVSIFFIVFTSAFVVVRLASQIRVHRRLFWDDMWLTLGLLFVCGVQGVNMWGIHTGLGKHAFRVMAEDPSPPSSFITLWKVGFLNSILIYLTLFTTKVSLLLLYKRLFWIARWFRICWYLNLVYATLWCIALTLVAIFQCTPIDYAWNRMYLLTHTPAPFKIEGTCVHQYFVTAAASLSLASDVGIWLLPMVAICKLQMTQKKKVEMGLLLSLGLVAVACGTVKTVISNKALTSRDVSWANAPLAAWASAEEAVGILCAAIPVIVGNFRAVRAMRSRKDSTGHSKYYEARSRFDTSTDGGHTRRSIIGSRRTRHKDDSTASTTPTSTVYGYGSDKSVVSNISRSGGIARGGGGGGVGTARTSTGTTGGGSRTEQYEDEEFRTIIEMEQQQQRRGGNRPEATGQCGNCGAHSAWTPGQRSQHQRDQSAGDGGLDWDLQRPPRRGADFV